MDIQPAPPTAYSGLAEGGPLDGSEISVGTAPHMGVRGLRVTVCVGQTLDESSWHVYNFGQRMDDRGGIRGRFVHIGALDGDPELPPGAGS